MTTEEQTRTILAYRAELRRRFGADWKSQPFWLNASQPARLSDNGISFYIWRAKLLDTRTTPDEAERG